MKKRLLFLLLLAALTLPDLAGAANPDSLKAYQLQGRRGIRGNDLKRAEAGFSRVLELDPDNFEALLNMGVVYSATGRNERARSTYLRAYAIDSTHADLLNNLGTANSNLGDHPAAVGYFQRAVQVDSSSLLYRANLGQELLRVGETEQALLVLRKVDSAAADNSVVAYSIGNAYSVKKAYDSAEVYYQKAVRAGGQSPELYYFLGLAQRNQGKLAAADTSFHMALEKKPDYLECLQATGLLYMMVGQYGDAVRFFDQAVGTDSSYQPAWISLGASTALSGAYARADTILQQLYSIDSALAFQMLDVIDREAARWKENPE